MTPYKCLALRSLDATTPQQCTGLMRENRDVLVCTTCGRIAAKEPEKK